MSRLHKTAMLLSACALLAGCGSRQPLKRDAGVPPVPVAMGAKEPATSDELMQPSTQARPDRSAEPLKRSEERQEDPFDLPPS